LSAIMALVSAGSGTPYSRTAELLSTMLASQENLSELATQKMAA